LIQSCLNCNKEFHAYPSAIKRGHALFCSRKCRGEYYQGARNPNHKGGKYLICARCGKKFWARPWEQKKGVKYCTQACYDEARRPGGAWAEHSVKCICHQCGIEFYAFRSEVDNKGRKYCSLNCYHLSQDKRVECTCTSCGKSFRVTKSALKYGRGKFCSPSCANALENNPGWLGGKSFEPYCHKFNHALKEYVRDKFGRRCFVCESPEIRRCHSIHHIDYNKLQGCKGMTWALVPLCDSCHMKTNRNRWHWFNLLIHYWAMNPDINFNLDCST
jgi:hypothetical protein